MKRFAALLLALSICCAPAWAQRSTASITMIECTGPVAHSLALIGRMMRRNVIADTSVPTAPFNYVLYNVTPLQALAIVEQANHLTDVRLPDGTIIVGTIDTMMHTGATASQTRVLRYADPTTFAAQIKTSLSAGANVAFDRSSRTVAVIGLSSDVALFNRLVAMLDQPTQTETETIALRRLTYADASEALRQAFASAAPGALQPPLIAGTAKTSAIVLSGPHASVVLAKQILEGLDTPQAAVTITFRLIDITPTNDEKHVGFIFGGVDSQGTHTPGQFFAQTRTAGPSFFAQLNALQRAGRARIVERPSFSVLSGNDGEFDVTNDYNFLTQSGGVVGSTAIQKVTTGIVVKASPTVDPVNKQITLALNGSFGQVTSFGPGGVPNIGSRVIRTTFRLMPGETILIGGLLTETSSRTDTKVPFLGDIPLLGHIFRDADTQSQADEVAIAITADLDIRHSEPINSSDPTQGDHTLAPAPPHSYR